MRPGGKRLLELTAGDVMSRDVMAFPLPMSVRTAAGRLSRAGVTGAPVVNDEGRCVGVISIHDVVRYLGRGPGPGRGCAAEAEPPPADDVARYMTGDVVTVPPGLPLGEVARRMLDAGIRRVVVADERRRPVGIVTATDVLAAVAAEHIRREAGGGVPGPTPAPVPGLGAAS